jgi:hypothetical protein
MADKTKIDERREREEYDRKNPWRPMTESVEAGLVCELLFSDMETSRTRHFILHEDGRWYDIDQQAQVGFGRKPMNWRPTNRKIGPAKRAAIITEANKRSW